MSVASLDPQALEFSLTEAEEAARLGASQLAGVLEATMDCVSSIDRRWRLTFFNSRARDHFGPKESLIGRSIFQTFPGIWRSEFRGAFRRAMFERRTSSVEAYLPESDAWYEMNIIPSVGGITFFFRDVSGRKRAEAVQSAAAERLQTTLDNLPQMLWAHWIDSGEEFYSKQWTAFTGVAIGRPDAPVRIELVHPEDRERASAVWKNSQRTGGDYRAEYRLWHNSGTYRWVHSRASPERNASGRIVAWYGTCTDVHERVLAGEALYASEKRFRDILDSMPQIVWSMAGGGRRPDYYNQRWYQFTGLPEGSLDGPEWVDLFHPEDVEQVLVAWRNSLATGEEYETEYRLRHRSGEYRWVASRGRAERGKAGEVLRWYGTCADIHQRVLARAALQQSEKRVRTILDSVPQIIWSAGPDGRLDYLSNQWNGTFGSPEPMIVRRQWKELLHPDDSEEAFRGWKHSVATGEPYEAEIRLLNPSGTYLWALVRALPERDEGGEIARWYGTCTDIHQRVVAQDALNESESLNRGIIEASPDCISLLDLGGTVLSVNAPTLVKYGVEDDSTLVGHRWASKLEDAARRQATEALDRAQKGEIGRVVVRSVPNGGTWSWRLSATMQGGPSGSSSFLAM